MRYSALIRCGNCLEKSRFGFRPRPDARLVSPGAVLRCAAQVCDAFVCAECECTGAYLLSIDADEAPAPLPSVH